MKFLIIICVIFIAIGTLDAQTLIATYGGKIPGSLIFYNGNLAYEERVPVEGINSAYSEVNINSLDDVTLFTWTPPTGRYYYFFYTPRDANPFYATNGYYFLTVPLTGYASVYDLRFHLADENGEEYFALDHANISSLIYNYDTQTYFYALQTFWSNLDVRSTFIYQGTSFTTNTSSSTSPLLNRFELNGNFPNPFNASTTISFNLPQSGNTSLHIFNILGQRIKTLIDGELHGGEHEILWDGRNESGHTVSSGQYFYQVAINGEVISESMILLK